jgi:phage minor structural protein
MLIITDLFGNSEALTDYKNVEIYEEVNGDFTLSFTCFFTENNEHSYPLVQEESIVEWEGHEFRIKKMAEVRNRKEIVAQHLFFELIDNPIYGITGGSLTLDSAAIFALSGSGWTFENVDVTDLKLLDNFGEDNSISLSTKICSEFQCERKIEPGRHLKFKREVGTDEDFQFQYKHNIKTLKRTVDTSNLTTVIKGYGADGLEVEYRSPNVAIYGERHAEPIRDERFTIAENLLEELPKAIKDVPEVSIELEVAELGFDAQLGDRVWLIYEPLNIEFQTRVMAYKRYPFLKRSPSVVLSNIKSTVADRLTETQIELKESKKDFRSKIQQTNENITLEVERIDDSIASLQIESNNITLSVQSLDSRIGSAEASISVQAGEISSKVSTTDYNGNTIASLINQSATAITISAQAIDLSGITSVNRELRIGETTDVNPTLKFGSYDTWLSADGTTFSISSSSSIQLFTPYTLDMSSLNDVNFNNSTVNFVGGVIDLSNALIDFSGAYTTGLYAKFK